MTSDERMAEIYAAISRAGIPALVLGGHAVRFYGVERNTIDFDLHLHMQEDAWTRLAETLGEVFRGRGGILEGPSWRPRQFRRFIIGRLPDGREERLECWRWNHLLAPFPELQARRTDGIYGGKTLAFLGLEDLIRSKETEREDDWRDIEFLEEILDERNRARAADAGGWVACLGNVRSRRGFETLLRSGVLADPMPPSRRAQSPRPDTLSRGPT